MEEFLYVVEIDVQNIDTDKQADKNNGGKLDIFKLNI